MVVDEEIAPNEILVRYVFSDDFKGKNLIAEKIITKNLLGPLRGGTSLQREKYCDESKCNELGNKIPNKDLVGFLIFVKDDFDKVKSAFIESNDNAGTGIVLDAFIKATPLDENFNILDFKNVKITIDTKGNPAHADIVYLKPKLIPDDVSFYEKPNTTIRSFSKKMFFSSNLVLNKSEDKSVYVGSNFKEYY
jgi:hypothetical protein